MEKRIIVIKKNGSGVDWDGNEIRNTVRLSATTIGKEVTDDLLDSVVDYVYCTLQKESEMFRSLIIHVNTGTIHRRVIDALEQLDKDLYNQCQGHIKSDNFEVRTINTNVQKQYKVLNLEGNYGRTVQRQIKEFIEDRTDISIVSTNIWQSGNVTYATVIYIPNI